MSAFLKKTSPTCQASKGQNVVAQVQNLLAQAIGQVLLSMQLKGKEKRQAHGMTH